MKTQILELLKKEGRMDTAQIAEKMGSLNRIVYVFLKQLGRSSQVRMVERENGDLKSCNIWYAI